MPTKPSQTSWRDEPVIPAAYDDITGLVRLARRARSRVVEFDWALAREELPGLRRAVFEWGTPTTGRYRRFDARVLEATRAVLSERNDAFILHEPATALGEICAVSCSDEGSRIRLRGEVTFDVLFGYGYAGADHDCVGSAHLAAETRETLVGAVDSLEWDVRRLIEPRFRAVRNALYGLPLGRGVEEGELSHGPEVEVAAHFHGPFAAHDDAPDAACLFTQPMAARCGVYLWSIDVQGAHRPWYVGQTRRSFGQRIGEHVACMLSGQYTVFDPDELGRGNYVLAGPALGGSWLETLPSILGVYPALVPSILGLLRMIRFHVAPVEGGKGHLDRVEGAIGRHFKAHRSRACREFFYPGIKLPAAIPGAGPLRLVLTSDAPLAGLPTEIREPLRSGGDGSGPLPFPTDVRRFVESVPWTFAKTYATTWPHEYVVRTPENTEVLLALARHIFEHGVEGRFYSEVNRYHHEAGKVYWAMDPTPESTDLINRCDETQTYEARLAAGTLPAR